MSILHAAAAAQKRLVSAVVGQRKKRSRPIAQMRITPVSSSSIPQKSGRFTRASAFACRHRPVQFRLPLSSNLGLATSARILLKGTQENCAAKTGPLPPPAPLPGCTGNDCAIHACVHLDMFTSVRRADDRDGTHHTIGRCVPKASTAF